MLREDVPEPLDDQARGGDQEVGPPVVFFMTGYGDSPIESEFLQTTAAVVLAKPLGIDELLARVHGVLLEPR